MPAAPANPKVYHITHVDNLPKIAHAGRLWSDAKRVDLDLDCNLVGMSTIKERRLTRLTVTCHPGTKVGDYVPFYFCPRSIMLYILYMGNHPDVTYSGGQDSIVHLVSDLKAVVDWAGKHDKPWAFSDRNAGASYANFYDDLDELGQVIDWDAVNATDFRDSRVKEGKQAEFLIHESLSWDLVEKIGVRDQAAAGRVRSALEGAGHQPDVIVQPSWYY